MPASNWDRPFDSEERLGSFTWTDSFSQDLQGGLYHACHEDDLLAILRTGSLSLRSTCEFFDFEASLLVPRVPAVWTGLNNYGTCCEFGPLVIKFPLGAVEGREFIVFVRKDAGAQGFFRERFFFVQSGALRQVSWFGAEAQRPADPEVCFDRTAEWLLSLKMHAIYCVVLTDAIPFERAEAVSPVSHYPCTSRKCAGIDRKTATQRLKVIVDGPLGERLKGIVDLAEMEMASG